MRIAIIALAAAALASAAGAHEAGVARPGGAFATFSAASADGCALACEADSLCIAWTWRADGACELKAVAPRPAPDANAVSGLASRAPAFARLLAPEPAPAELRARSLPPDPPAPAEAEEAAEELLGGPLEEERPPLRARLDDGAAPAT